MAFAVGGGAYFKLKDSTERFVGILSVDYLRKNNEFDDCLECPTKAAQSKFQSATVGIGALWANKIGSRINFMFGPQICYAYTDVIREGQFSNWTEAIKAHHFGAGLLINFEFQRIFKSPIDFDMFICPTYLGEINTATSPLQVETKFSNGLFAIPVQLGFSYNLKSLKDASH